MEPTMKEVPRFRLRRTTTTGWEYYNKGLSNGPWHPDAPERAHLFYTRGAAESEIMILEGLGHQGPFGIDTHMVLEPGIPGES